MDSHAHTPGPVPLRLVGADDAAEASPPARRAAALENHLASGLSPTDVRAALAVDVARAIEGGRAAILRPERRRALLAGARARGMREFDANLVIAVVQDAARRGVPTESPEVHATLGVIPGVDRPEDRSLPVLLAAAIGLALFVALAAWTLGA